MAKKQCTFPSLYFVLDYRTHRLRLVNAVPLSIRVGVEHLSSSGNHIDSEQIGQVNQFWHLFQFLAHCHSRNDVTLYLLIYSLVHLFESH